MPQNDDTPHLTPEEAKAVAALQRLAKRWPQSLTLASMGGDLVVVHSGDPRFLADHTVDRAEAILADVYGIPNTGGDW